MNETLGRDWFGSLVCMNVVFMPMFIVGLAGVSAACSTPAPPTTSRGDHADAMSSGARGSCFRSSSISGASGTVKATENMAGHDHRVVPRRRRRRRTFAVEPQAYRGAYGYSVPGADKDFRHSSGLIRNGHSIHRSVRRDTV
jgi:hypothetical protein